jgi:hypothetical protein
VKRHNVRRKQFKRPAEYISGPSINYWTTHSNNTCEQIPQRQELKIINVAQIVRTLTEHDEDRQRVFAAHLLISVKQILLFGTAGLNRRPIFTELDC